MLNGRIAKQLVNLYFPHNVKICSALKCELNYYSILSVSLIWHTRLQHHLFLKPVYINTTSYHPNIMNLPNNLWMISRIQDVDQLINFSINKVRVVRCQSIKYVYYAKTNLIIYPPIIFPPMSHVTLLRNLYSYWLLVTQWLDWLFIMTRMCAIIS